MEEGYYRTKESVEEYISLAKDVSGASLIQELQQFLSAGATVLEIGSGPGTDWEILQNDYQVTGSDNSQEFLKHLRAAYPKGNFLELDALSLETEERFDRIYANKVMHHLNDEELQASLMRQHAVLNADGIVCHSFWQGEGSEVFKGLFVNYHTEEALRGFYARDFEILMLAPYAEFEAGDSLLLIARKK